MSLFARMSRWTHSPRPTRRAEIIESHDAWMYRAKRAEKANKEALQLIAELRRQVQERQS